MGYLTFISHSGEDTWIARKIQQDCELCGAASFLDEVAISAGTRFETEIHEALRSADELVVLLTPWAMDRPYVWLEIGAAWLREIPIIALLLGVSLSDLQARSNLPIALKERSALSLRHAEKYFEQLKDRALKNPGES